LQSPLLNKTRIVVCELGSYPQRTASEHFVICSVTKGRGCVVAKRTLSKATRWKIGGNSIAG
jgi:hypothetical protein